MATSGAYGFDPEIAEHVDEAFERVGVDPETLTGRHLRSALRSISYLLSDWANDGGSLPWARDTVEFTLTASDADFTVSDSLAILGAVLRRDGVDTPMQPISEHEYLLIPNKDTEGRPDRFWAKQDQGELTVTLWPVPENSTDKVVYTRLRYLQEPGALSNTVHIPQNWAEAFAAGMAWKLAGKYAPEREDTLMARAERMKNRAMTGSRSRTSVVIRPSSRRARRG